MNLLCIIFLKVLYSVIGSTGTGYLTSLFARLFMCSAVSLLPLLQELIPCLTNRGMKEMPYLNIHHSPFFPPHLSSFFCVTLISLMREEFFNKTAISHLPTTKILKCFFFPWHLQPLGIQPHPSPHLNPTSTVSKLTLREACSSEK